jgi:hypothetical protein
MPECRYPTNTIDYRENADAGLILFQAYRYLITEPGVSPGFPVAFNLSEEYLHDAKPRINPGLPEE